MEARASRTAALCAALVGLVATPSSVCARGAYRTPNFVVTAPSPPLAREIGETAERCREELAVEWLGRTMPPWGQPCTIDAKVAPDFGAGGATTFVFDRGEVFGWEMTVQGSRERVLDSVIPHEVTHTVFASHFRQPLPRWADEGACTTVEHRSEVGKQERLLIKFLKTGKGIPFTAMFAMKEYPADVLPLYAQGHSLTQYLLERRGKPAFLGFLADGMRDENWRRAVAEHYGYDNLYALQEQWLAWVREGRPRLRLDPDVTLASATTPVPPDAAERSSVAPDATPAGLSIGPVAMAATPRRASVYSASSPATSEPPARESVYDASRGDATVWR